MAKIQDLSVLDRPRERALKYGIDKLSNAELLAILISSGVKDESALDIANRLISENCGLANLKKLSFKDLMSYKGIGLAKSLNLVTCFEIASRLKEDALFTNEYEINNESIINRFKDFYDKQANEIMLILCISGNKLYSYRVISMGSESNLSASKKTILNEVINSKCSSFYLIHNHPSGNPEPSEQDIKSTTEIIFLAKDLKLRLIDHLIITKDRYYSFTKNEIFSY